jgi:tetratricopeptide (TPR) repeat protein
MSQDEKTSASSYDLPDWPYAKEYVEASLDPEQIARHGLAHLCRALDIGHVVAFVGSGTSISYGRVSWQGLVEELKKKVESTYRKEKERKETSGERLSSTIENVYATLQTLSESSGDTNPTERYPTLFQIVEQLSLQLGAEEKNRPALTSDFVKKHHKDFRRMAMQITYDDREHARQIIRDALDIDLDKEKEKSREDRAKYLPAEEFASAELGTDLRPFSRNFPTPNTAPDYYWYLRYFTTEIAQNLSDVLELNKNSQTLPGLGQFILSLQMLAGVVLVPRTEIKNLLPLHRFLIASLSLLTPTPRDKSSAICKVEREPMTASRRQIIPEARDPIALLAMTLNIRRFLTTNFDFEIERMLEAAGYRFDTQSGDLSQADRISPPKGRALDFSFRGAKAAQLIDFTMYDRSVDYQVCHLHGRAIDGEEEDIVVTAQDYNRAYVRNDETRHLVDESIKLAFGANPLFFVGHGMREEDLLRPLRQFLSEKIPRTDRLAIALLPGAKKAPDRRREVISYFVLYGVYILHSGCATIRRKAKAKTDEAGTEIDKTQTETHPDWLATVIGRTSQLRDGIGLLEELCGLSTAIVKRDSYQIRADLMRLRLKLKTSDSPSLNENGLLLQGVVKLDGIPVDDEHIINREIGLLNAAIELLLAGIKSVLETESDAHGVRFRHIYKSLRITVEGVADAITSASICAKLRSIHLEWLQSSKEWTSQPEMRSVRFSALASFEQVCGFDPNPENFAARHRVVPAPAFKKNENEPGRTFEAFLAAVNQRHVELRPAANARPPGRRLLLVIGERGVGKGQFTTWFQQCPQVARFLLASTGELPQGPIDIQGARGHVAQRCEAALFINLSYSAELGSVWDRLGELLLDIARKKRAISERDIGELSRHDRLAYALELLSKAAIERRDPKKKSTEKRILLFFNSVDILFDADGFPKNAQIRRTFETLISPDYVNAPIDLIFVTEEGRLPVYFRRDEISDEYGPVLVTTGPTPGHQPDDRTNVVGRLASLGRALRDDAIGNRLAELERAWNGPMRRVALDFIVRPDANEFTKRELLQRRERLHLNVGLRDGASPQSGQQSLSNFVHFLRPANPLRYANLYHLPLLMLLGLGNWRGLCKGANLANVEWWQLTEVARNLAEVKVQDYEEPWIKDLIKDVYDEADIAGFAIRYVVALRNITQLIDPHLSFVDKFDDALSAYEESAHELQFEAARCLAILDEFYRDIGRNRFNMTVLLRAAERVCEESDAQINAAKAKSVADTIKDDGSPLLPIYSGITNFLDATLRRILASGSSQRDEVLLGEVIRQYGLMHAKDLLSPEVKLSDDVLGTLHVKTHSAAKFQLQQSILLHIALIGQPVEADVLAASPEIWDRAIEIVTPTDAAETTAVVGSAKAKKIAEVVAEQLDVLVARHLLFEIDPDPRAQSNARRFALHRTVSRFVTRKLEGPLIDFSQADFFSVSLYSVQQRDIARPTAESYRFLKRLLTALIYYPSGLPNEVQIAEQIGDYNIEQLSQAARRLHAAHGIVRAVFSVVVVSRFIDIERLHDRGARPLGLFEEHRLFVRWMLKLAIAIDQRTAELQRREPIIEAGSIAPFFREQIVWLHNECGMFAQVQGDMNDAICHFDQALDYIASSRLEGRRSEGGALDARIRLNRAIAAIDCGLGREQLADLHRIVETSDEHPAIRASALGWIGRIEQLAGNQAAARDGMERAIRSLESLGHLRGASIFHRHMGSLSWQMKDKDKGRDHFRQAKALAEAGGHEDVRQYALLALVRSEADIEERKFRPQTAKELQSIESYARAMGIARLESDVYRSRGYLLFYQGEVSLAGSYAERALEVATLKNLLLRKISAMILLARTYDERGHGDASVQLLNRAVELARKANYQIAIDRAEIALAKVGPRLAAQ